MALCHLSLSKLVQLYLIVLCGIPEENWDIHVAVRVACHEQLGLHTLWSEKHKKRSKTDEPKPEASRKDGTPRAKR